MTRRLILSPEAEADLDDIYDYITARNGAARAGGYVERLLTSCRKLEQFPLRGERRDDLELGLRVLGFERRAVIAFYVDDKSVIIARILYGGRDLSGAFARIDA